MIATFFGEPLFELMSHFAGWDTVKMYNIPYYNDDDFSDGGVMCCKVYEHKVYKYIIQYII